jgi:glycosyltransferase involved in cell wall biosynthesis
MMEDHGIRFDLVVFERLLGILPHWRRNLRRLSEVRAQLKGRVYFRFLITTFLGWDFWIPQNQLYSIARPHDQTVRTVIHARTQTSAVIALRLKNWIPKTKVVFDMRGDTPAEYLYSVEKSGGDSRSAPVQRKYEKLKGIERQAIKGSDAILSVSGVMRDKIIREYQVPCQKIQVIPTVASTRKFYWDPQMRRVVRKELGIEDKLTLIYAGSIRAYQSLDMLLDFFRKLQEKRPELHLLLITPQRAEAEQLLHKSLSSGTYTIRSSGHNEMVSWLNAADAGLLLRESNAVNQVAAPTKFAEYLLCGLPIVITAGIGDFSELVRKENVGIVLEGSQWEEELHAHWNELDSLIDPFRREQIAQLGKQRFSNEHFANLLTSLYSALFEE